MKTALTLQPTYIIKDFKYSFAYLLKDKRKLLLAFLVFIFIPLLNISWKFIDPSISAPYYDSLQIFVWTLGESVCMVLTSTAWYLSAARKDYATKLLALGSVYYWIFILLNKIPFEDITSLVEELTIFVSIITAFTLLIRYIKNNYINRNVNYKEEYDGMVYDYHHLCRGFTKTVEGLNNLKEKGYITEEEYSSRLVSVTERFDDFAMKIHNRYQELV
ncbi:hypothetical protein [Nafulsella turpanensis]|uniref:hypothetical protein n=1 Tax=Nafulsella turpanensis TaxID=1265690 RepID=UPI00034B4227|nr:hypothetical protein [Nafulsella turpanensis]